MSRAKKSRHIWKLWENPIFMMGLRTRLRRRMALGWGVITVTVAAFTFLVVYLSAVERGIPPATAAKSAVVPLLVIQGIILMLLGTGQVASGIAHDRDIGTLNFQRMTPMSPASKILGYLFGLPARQYMMFLLTMPFMMAAILISKISIWKVLHFYLVFFTTVWLYHMIGMVSGMITPRARHASRLALVAIALLYLTMPSLSRMGFTFFGFVTVVPTFQVLLVGELMAHPMAVKRLGNSPIMQQPWSELQFFSMPIHPTVYTLLVQGMLLLTCFVVVSRKWHREENHALPKGYALGFFAWVQIFVVGSLWPFLASGKKLLRVVRQWGRMSPELYHNLLLYIFFFLAGCVGLWLIYVVSPVWFTYIKGLRRTKKLKLARLPAFSDGATSFWFALAFVVMTCVSYVVLLRLMISEGRAFQTPPQLHQSLVLPLLFTGFLLSMQGLREYFEKRGFLFALFLLWVLPSFVGIILMAAFQSYTLAAYVLTVTPMLSFVYGLQYLNLDIITKTVSRNYAGHIPALSWLSVCFHWGLAFVMLMLLRKKKQQVREQEAKRRPGTTGELVSPKNQGPQPAEPLPEEMG